MWDFRKAICMGLILFWGGFSLGDYRPQEEGEGYDRQLPNVKIERNFSFGTRETLQLGCRRDAALRRNYICKVSRERNGVLVAATQIPFERSRELVKEFMVDYLKVSRALNSTIEGEQGPTTLSWSMGLDKFKVEGHVPKHEKRSKKLVLEVVMRLEGDLASEFYR